MTTSFASSRNTPRHSIAAAISSWTVLSEHSETVRAIVSPERDGYAVRDQTGHVLGRYATVKQALENLPSEH